MTPRAQLRIGNWNVRTMNADECARAPKARETQAHVKKDRGEEPDGDHGMMCASRRQIEKVGHRVLRPYLSLGVKVKVTFE